MSSGLHDRVGNEDLFTDMPLYHSWDAYGLSKLAMIHMAREIERRFGETHNLHAVAIHPGVVMTNLTLPQAFRGRMGKAAHRIGSALTSLVLLSPNAGAQTIVMCASARPIQGWVLLRAVRYRRTLQGQPGRSGLKTPVGSVRKMGPDTPDNRGGRALTYTSSLTISS